MVDRGRATHRAAHPRRGGTLEQKRHRQQGQGRQVLATPGRSQGRQERSRRQLARQVRARGRPLIIGNIPHHQITKSP